MGISSAPESCNLTHLFIYFFLGGGRLLFVDDMQKLRGCYVILGLYGDSVFDAVFSFLPPEKVATG